MRQIVLDTETTGLDPDKGHRLTEIGCLEIMNRRLTGRTFQTYINPERPVDKGAEQITGLTQEFLQDKPKFHEIVEGFLAFIGTDDTEIIIHNAPFDLGFINTELTLIQHPCVRLENVATIIDTLVMARQMHPGQKNSLDALCARYRIDNTHRQYHGALLDAEILAKVYLSMTSGQTSLSMEAESLPEQNTRAKRNVRKAVQRNSESLKVVYAEEEELQIHEKRLLSLNN